MAAYRTPGPFYSVFADPIDGGTLCRARNCGPHELTTPNAAAVAPEARSPGKLSMSTEAVRLLQEIEEVRLQPYDDRTGKEITKWTPGATIGYGHLITASQWEIYRKGMTKEYARTLFDRELPSFVDATCAEIKVPLKQCQFDALCLFAFNVGAAGFSRSSAVRLVNDPTARTGYRDLESAWKAFNRSRGKVNEGLVKRRNCEWNVYSQGVYKKW